MGFGDVLGQAMHSSSAVPRLYVAARKAGLGTSDTLEVLRISRDAMTSAARHGRGVPGRANAMRHFLWQAVLTARFGVDAARTIAAAQETGTPSLRDSRVDAHNNEVGQAYGAEHAEDLRPLTPGEAMTSLVPVALAKWESDELIWIR